MDMFFQDDDDDAFTWQVEERVVTKLENQSYKDIVQDLIFMEEQYLRDLKMIIKVFREPFARLFPTSKVRNVFETFFCLYCPENYALLGLRCSPFMIVCFDFYHN